MRRTGPSARPLAALLVVAAAATACAAGDADRADGGDRETGTVTVLAAASLTDAFGAVAGAFTRAHPGTEVDLSFAASSELVAQIQEGAPADVFASADEPNMRKLVESGDVDSEPITFARNTLAIAVERGNPEGVGGIADLARGGVRVALCAAEVPCGRYADEALDKAGVALRPATRAESVRNALGLVELGEVDAAIVYVTDVTGNDAVQAVTIAPEHNVETTLLAAPVGTPDAATSAWLDFLTSADARRILVDELGFRAP